VKLVRGESKWRSIESVAVMDAPKVAAVVWVENSKVQEHGE